VEKEHTPTLEARGFKDPPVVGKPDNAESNETAPPPMYIARRLLPAECCLLQGYPLGWTENLGTEQPTDEEIHWWAAVFEDWYRAQGKKTRSPSAKRVAKWLKDPRTDGAEYKAYGNSVAVPVVHFVLAGIVWAVETEAAHSHTERNGLVGEANPAAFPT
jgi:DNA (cytosine-5)-methyltransferase 1